ncbi:MAG: hypothetical protein ACI9SP_002459 [Arenicella sp.]|jgi:hypothetical protein
MSIKLFKLREFVSLEDASLYLTEGIGDHVSRGEVIRLALNKQLQLSITLNELEFGRYGQHVRSKNGAAISYSLSDGYLELSEEVTSNLLPIFDLAMVGHEVDLLKELYSKYTNKAIDYVQSVKGLSFVILKDSDRYFQLFEEYDRNPEYLGSNASADELFDEMFGDSYRPSSHVAEGMRKDHDNDRAEFLKENFHTWLDDRIYVPARLLPSNSSLIVRVDELNRFIESFSSEADAVESAPKPLGSRERNTLLVLIATLCKEAGIDYEARGMAAVIEKMTELNGTRISNDKIREILVLLPQAVETRTK